MIRSFRLFLLGLTFISFSACESDPFGSPIDALPRSLSVAEQALVSADIRFSLDLLQEISRISPEQNFMVSPLSISMALGMLRNGAKNDTEVQIAKALYLDEMTDLQINEGYRDLIDLLLNLDPRVEMSIANSIWAHEGFPFKAAFFDSNAQYFGAELGVLDFLSPSAVGTINGWVEGATNGKIPKVLDQIDPGMVMFLINAVYFKGDWTHAFRKDQTASSPFRLSDGTQKMVTTMAGAKGQIFYTDRVRGAELEYGGSAFVMQVIVPEPNANLSLNELVQTLDITEWSAILADPFDSFEGDVSMPKFRITKRLNLIEPLKTLGVVDVFDRDLADLSDLTEVPDVYVQMMQHDTFIDVDEDGAEAAAVTTSGVYAISGPITIDIRDPFVFVIREKYSGTILFLGKVMDPS